MQMMFTPPRKHIQASKTCYRDSFTFMFVYMYVCMCVCVCVMFIPNMKQISGHHSLLEDSFTFSYVDDVRTSEETHKRTSTACYGIALIFFLFLEAFSNCNILRSEINGAEMDFVFNLMDICTKRKNESYCSV
jgi:hypothetical protein